MIIKTNKIQGGGVKDSQGHMADLHSLQNFDKQGKITHIVRSTEGFHRH